MSALPDEPTTEELVAEVNEDEPTTEPEPEPDNEPEPEPEPEPTEPTGPDLQAVMEERFKDAGSAFKSYTTRINNIFEEEALNLVECPLCSGGVPGFLHIGDAGHVAPDTEKAVLTFMGVTQEADYQDDPEHRSCPRCAGLGKVKTGSRVANQERIVCETCKGYGYVPPPVQGSNGLVPTPLVPVLVGAEPEYTPPADADPWGSPRLLDSGLENPNYGRMPQFKDSSLP